MKIKLFFLVLACWLVYTTVSALAQLDVALHINMPENRVNGVLYAVVYATMLLMAMVTIQGARVLNRRYDLWNYGRLGALAMVIGCFGYQFWGLTAAEYHLISQFAASMSVLLGMAICFAGFLLTLFANQLNRQLQKAGIISK